MLDTSLTSSNFYFLLAVFQGLILSGLIIFLPPRKKPHIYIGILIFLVAIALLHSVLESSIHAFNSKFPVPLSYRFAFGPLAYLHILHIKDPTRNLKRKDLLHFIPALIFDVVVFIAAFLYIGSNMEWAQNNIPLIQGIAILVALVSIIQLAFYTYLIRKESLDTNAVLKDFNNVRKWLSLLIVSWCLVIGLHMIAIPISLFFIEQLDDNAHLLYIPFGVFQALWILVLAYSYVTVYAKVVNGYMDKIRNFKFESNEIEHKKTQLLEVLDQDHLYKDPKLTIAKLAGHLGWPINSASKIINDILLTNFNDLINQYRVDAFKQLTLEPEHKKFSILGLGQEVGFSSKASFYRVFKKETGMTPSEFMKNQV